MSFDTRVKIYDPVIVSVFASENTAQMITNWMNQTKKISDWSMSTQQYKIIFSWEKSDIDFKFEDVINQLAQLLRLCASCGAHVLDNSVTPYKVTGPQYLEAGSIEIDSRLWRVRIRGTYTKYNVSPFAQEYEKDVYLR